MASVCDDCCISRTRENKKTEYDMQSAMLHLA